MTPPWGDKLQLPIAVDPQFCCTAGRSVEKYLPGLVHKGDPLSTVSCVVERHVASMK